MTILKSGELEEAMRKIPKLESLKIKVRVYIQRSKKPWSRSECRDGRGGGDPNKEHRD